MSLPATDIAIWLMRLDVSERDLTLCSALLSRDEKTRATRYHFEQDRRRFIVARAILRVLLGGHLDHPPAKLRFRQSPYGKPYLTAPPGIIHFNVSHSGDAAIYAISSSRTPGVDIECVNREIDAEGLLARFFTRRERICCGEIAAQNRKRAILTAWTRKEAIVKALGDGLTHPLDQLEVMQSADSSAQSLSIICGNYGHWSLYSVNAGRDYVATVAALTPP